MTIFSCSLNLQSAQNHLAPRHISVNSVPGDLQLSLFMNFQGKHFLLSNKKVSPAKIVLVMGNESSDLDSVLGAMMYAYLLSRTEYSADSFFLPFIGVPRKELRLRKDVMHVLDSSGIDPDSFVYADELTEDILTYHPNFKVILFDHNKLPFKFRFFQNHVREIIDHHRDSKETPSTEQEIKKVGSATTLVARRFISQYPHLLNKDIAYYLLVPILADTKNFRHPEKTTKLDITISKKLLNYLPAIDRKALYNHLLDLKMDTWNLTTAEKIAMDYKGDTVLGYGISSLKHRQSLKKIIKKDPGFCKTVENFCRRKQIKILLITNKYVKDDDEIKPQLLIYARDPSLLKSLMERFQRGVRPILGDRLNILLQKKWRGNFSFFKYDSRYNRKMLQPYLEEIMKDLKLGGNDALYLSAA